MEPYEIKITFFEMLKKLVTKTQQDPRIRNTKKPKKPISCANWHPIVASILTRMSSIYRIQVNASTLKQQLTAWRNLVLDYTKANKQSILDVREAQRWPLFTNSAISRQLPEDGIITVMRDLSRTGNAEAIDKSQKRWYVYWQTLEELGTSVYKWAIDRGMTGTVCTFFELVGGDSTTDEIFHGLDEDILLKALQWLESQRKAEIIIIDDSKGVKFF